MNAFTPSSHPTRAQAQSRPAARRTWAALMSTSALAVGLALAPMAQADGGRHGAPGMHQGMHQGAGLVNLVKMLLNT